ncbi:MAG: DUF2079 domain-containing protein [Candidatus Baltobacteraceae bacterium]
MLVGIVVYAAVMGGIAAYRWHIWTFGTDTGTFSQVVLDAFGGFRDGPEQGTHFRFHWAPMLATLYPLVALTRSALSLEFAQIALSALAAVPLYALVRAHASERLAVACGLLALFYPPLVAVAFLEFHEIAFYAPVAIALFWAADRARWRAFAAFALVAVLIREEACVVFALVGLVFASLGWVARDRPGAGLLVGAPREPRRLVVAGLGLSLAAAAALGIYFGLVIPRVGMWQPVRFYDYPFAHGPLGVALALLAHPAYLCAVLTWGRLGYVLEALGPLAFLPLRSRWSLLALPGLVGVLLSSDAIAWRMGSHYAGIWIPWLLIGTAATLVDFERKRSPQFAGRAFGAIVACSVLFFVAFNPTHVLHYLRPVYAQADARRALALVPRGATMITHDEWFARIALTHPNATVFMRPDICYAVWADDFPNEYYQHVLRPQFRADVAAGSARIVESFGKVRVYESTAARCARAAAARISAPQTRG